MGQEDARETLNVIESVVRAMAKLPGQRTLILVSPGFFSDSPETTYFKSEVLNQAAAANVIISALDARGMVVDTTGADHVMSELAAGTGGAFFDHSNDLEGGLKSLTVPPEFLYLLELSLKASSPMAPITSFKSRSTNAAYMSKLVRVCCRQAQECQKAGEHTELSRKIRQALLRLSAEQKLYAAANNAKSSERIVADPEAFSQ